MMERPKENAVCTTVTLDFLSCHRNHKSAKHFHKGVSEGKDSSYSFGSFY